MVQDKVQGKLLRRFFQNLNNESFNVLIPSKPGMISIWIFPIFAFILITIISLLWWIHHPEILYGYAVLKEVDIAKQMIVVEVDNPRNGLASMREGQSVRIKAIGNAGVVAGMLKGRLGSVSESNGQDKVVAIIQLRQAESLGPVARAVYKTGAKVDLLIVISDMPLLLRILNTSANNIGNK